MKLIEATNGRYGGEVLVPDRTVSSGPQAWRARPLWRSGRQELPTRTSDYVGRFLANHYAILAMRIVLSSIFLLSAVGKLIDIERYSIIPVFEFGILPSPVALVFGAALPFIELLCALGLAFGILTRLSSFGIAAMSAVFFFAKAFLLWQGYDVNCGCFGAIMTTLISFSIYLDPPIFLMALAVTLAPSPARQWVSLGSRMSQHRKKAKLLSFVATVKYRIGSNRAAWLKGEGMILSPSTSSHPFSPNI